LVLYFALRPFLEPMAKSEAVSNEEVAA